MNTTPSNPPASAIPPTGVPLPLLVVFRGIGQVFFQESALSGAIFVLAIALSSPLMATVAVVGSAVGTAAAYALKFDQAELSAGIFGFNPALVCIAAVFFFPLSAIVIGLLIAGCVVSTVLTRAMRLYLPFPTFTTPFIVTTWGMYLLAKALGQVPDPGSAPIVPNVTTGFYVEAIAQGVSQVMFQESIWTGLLFLVGIAVRDRWHALLVLTGAAVGTFVAVYHFSLGADAIDPDRLIRRHAFDVIRIGLYGFNATLAPVALSLGKKSLIAPLLGMMLTVPLTELVPWLGLPTLTAPFVMATWLVLVLAWLENRLHHKPTPAP